jgi:arylsulfatase A-like enzyme/Tfp pilus assembly protein PilF
MGFLGSQRGLTPNLDALAKQSVVFSRAYSQVPLTSPSHATILSGTYPQFNRVNDFGMPLAQTLPYLPQILHDHGYQTAAFVGSVILDPKFGASPGFDRGFDQYDTGFASTGDRYQVYEHRAADVVAHAADWLRSRSRGSCFVWIHLFDPHAPYESPEPYKSRYAANPYDGEIAYADSALGTLIEQLKKQTLFDSSLIAVMSDHGEAFGEHGERNHGIFLYDETIHVPLLIKLPGQHAGTRVDQRASLVDVMPTILQALSISIPKSVQGKSLLALMTSSVPGASQRKSEDRPSYAETDYPYRDFGWSSLRSLRSDKYLYIEAPRKELYDQTTDPQAAHDLSTKSPAITQTLGSKLTEFRRGTENTAKASESSMSPAVGQKLAALGYVSSGSVVSSESNQDRADPKDKIEIANLVQEALLARESGHLQDATSALEKALSQDPGNAVVNRNIGTIWMDQQDYARALPYLRKAVELSPNTAMDRYNLGLAYLSSGNIENAKTELEAAVSKSTKENLQSLGNLHYTLGAVYSRLGRTDDAKRELRKSLALQPDDYESNLIMGQMLAQDDPSVAVPYLQKAAKVQPTSADPHILLFQIYTALGDAASAAKERTEAERLRQAGK